MGLEQWGASEQYYKIASRYPEYELGRVISQEKDLFRVVMDKEECMALNRDFNIRRLERYLSIAWDSGAVPVIILTKIDLCDDLQAKRFEIENVALGVPVMETSGLTGDGLQQIKPYLQKTKTVAFIGSSGVGKSTLINRLLGEERLKSYKKLKAENSYMEDTEKSGLLVFIFKKGRKEMGKSNIMIRLEKNEEQRKVENLVRDSFWNVYCPGCLEHYVLHQLRNDPAFVPELDFVMLLKENDEDGKLIGQNMFMRTSIKADDGRYIPIMTMGPICIKNEYKRKGYGKILLDYSLEKAAELGCGALCFEGNIDFYGKSGFRQASEYGIRYHGLPEGEDASFFLCKELVPGYFDGITGEYATPEGYLVDEQEAEEFDKQFPYKEKKKVPGQLF